jgi:ATP-dependent RNA helicase DeaD
MSKVSFQDLSLTREIDLAIKDMGFTYATEIQAKAIPIIKQGFDIIGKSQTGTGKTLSFGIPALELLNLEKSGVQVLILCPTRELAVQACEELMRLSKFKKGVRIADIYGGAPMDRQITKLKTANIVVGTPGRIMDHLKRGTLHFENLEMAILDEADEMLSMGFIDDIKTILRYAPEKRQTILFSATMPPEILELTRRFIKDPKLIEINKKQVTVENIIQCYYNVPSRKRIGALLVLLMYYKPNRSIVFCNTKKMVDTITSHLKKNGFDVEGLHGDMKQAQRNIVMNAFKNGNIKILVATDVAARGIDVQDIDWVLNYDIPQNVEYYVHRIGRTGRAGKSGRAITICSGRSQVDLLKHIGRIVKSNIVEEKLPHISEILSKQYEIDIEKIEDKLKNGSNNNEYKNMAEKFIDKGYDLIDIAAVAFEMLFENRDNKIKSIESIESPTEDIRSTRSSKYQKVLINIGSDDLVEPKHLVAAITRNSDITGKEIGRIDISAKRSLVDISRDKAELLVKQMKNCKIRRIPVEVSLYQEYGNIPKTKGHKPRMFRNSGRRNIGRPYVDK